MLCLALLAFSCSIRFPLFCALCCVSRAFLGTRSRATSCFLYLLATSHVRCLVLLGFSCFTLVPSFCALSISFLCFSRFSRYPFSCHVVPFPLSGPLLTSFYQAWPYFLILFAHLPMYLQRQTCEITFFPNICLNTSKMYRYILEVFLGKFTSCGFHSTWMTAWVAMCLPELFYLQLRLCKWMLNLQ